MTHFIFPLSQRHLHRSEVYDYNKLRINVNQYQL